MAWKMRQLKENVGKYTLSDQHKNTSNKLHFLNDVHFMCRSWKA